MSTMRDVAKKAGVSVATVSCALSGAKNVSPKSMKKIQDAIRELQYIPNSAARSLKTLDSTEIGVILTDIDDSFYVDILKGISSTLQKYHYNMTIAFSSHSQEVEREKIEYLIGKNICGLILMTCQSNQTAYFQEKLFNRNIPTVFIEQRPTNLDTNFICFDNKRIIGQITQRLIELNYKYISLVCGLKEWSSQKDCMNGFLSALEPFPHVRSSVCNTSMSQEDAFKTTLYAYHGDFPDAIIATSTTIAKGILETANLLSRKVPDDVLLITLGEESWNRSSIMGNILSTSRSAITFGSRAADLLIQNIRSPYLFENKTIVMEDHFPVQNIMRPKTISHSPFISAPVTEEINILSLNFNITNAMRLLSEKFTHNSGICVHFHSHFEWTCDLLNTLLEENERKTCLYDMYIFDVPWIYYIASHELLADISPFIQDNKIPTEKFIPQNLKTCIYNNRYYGIPFMGGSQILFYRKDYFKDPTLKRAFEKKYKISLRPPRTWTEFNGICEFFTRKYNPLSPSMYGTSFALNHSEEFACSILPCIWSHGGDLFDSENNPCVNSLQNVRAFHNLLQTLNYTDGNYLNTTLNDSIKAFSNGETAMIICFSEYVSSFNLTHEMNDKIGFALIPGRCPILPGWNLGISKFTKKREAALQFLNWFCHQDISSYLTILDGQSTVQEPYENNELKRLYPWLSLTTDSLNYCRKRRPPLKKGGNIIPPNKMESIITDAFYKTCKEPSQLEAFLDAAQEQMIALFKEYKIVS